MGFRILTALALTALGWAGQTVPAHRLVITLPYGTNPDGVMIRYVLAGQDFGGWAQRSGNSLVINTMAGGVPARAVKAIAYIPGCAIETLDTRLSDVAEEQTSLACRSLQTTSIAGRLVQSGLITSHNADLQVFYIARWAHDWLGLADASVLAIPVSARSVLSPDGAFRISVPDFADDAIVKDGIARDGGELEIWAMDSVSHARLGQLIVTNPPAVVARMSGLKILANTRPPLFSFPCLMPHEMVRDEFGFAIRNAVDGCDRYSLPGVN